MFLSLIKQNTNYDCLYWCCVLNMYICATAAGKSTFVRLLERASEEWEVIPEPIGKWCNVQTTENEYEVQYVFKQDILLRKCFQTQILNNISPSIPVGAQHVPEERRQSSADVIWQAQSLVLHFPDLRLPEPRPFAASASFCQTSAGRATSPVLRALCLQWSVHTINRTSEQFGKVGVKRYVFISPDMCLPPTSLSLEIWMRLSGLSIKTGIRGSSPSLRPRSSLMPWSIFVLILRYHTAPYMRHGSPVVT